MPWCPHQESNLDQRLRSPLLYPLSYEGSQTVPTLARWVNELVEASVLALFSGSLFENRLRLRQCIQSRSLRGSFFGRGGDGLCHVVVEPRVPRDACKQQHAGDGNKREPVTDRMDTVSVRD